MKKTFIALALAATAVSAPAMARDFTGPRVELTAGVNDVENFKTEKDVSYGAVLGVDFEVAPRVVIGAEVNADNVFNRNARELGAAARLGYAVTDNVLVYGKAGYSNLDTVAFGKLDGLRVGGGLDVVLGNSPFYVGAEYKYADFESGIGRHQGLAKIGIRF